MSIQPVPSDEPEVVELIDEFFGSEGLKPEFAKIRQNVLARLMAEHPRADTIDQMLLERVSYAYARIRQREAAGMFGSERNYKAASTMLATFMAEVRKGQDREEMLGMMQADIFNVVVGTIHEAVQGLSPVDQRTVVSKVVSLVQQEGEKA